MGFNIGKSIRKVGKKYAGALKKGVKGVRKIADSELGRTLITTGANVALPGVGGAVAGKAFELRDSLKTVRDPKLPQVSAQPDVEDFEQRVRIGQEEAAIAPAAPPEAPAPSSDWRRYIVPVGGAVGGVVLVLVLVKVLRARRAA